VEGLISDSDEDKPVEEAGGGITEERKAGAAWVKDGANADEEDTKEVDDNGFDKEVDGESTNEYESEEEERGGLEKEVDTETSEEGGGAERAEDGRETVDTVTGGGETG